MPVVPRNTQTESRITPVPGVPSISPRGAEAIGDQASAIGRQASLLGAEAHATGQRFGAIQDAFDSVADSAVTADRIQRIREARQVDEGMAQYKTHMANAVYGTTDEKGKRIPGTMEIPYTPSDNQADATGASIATAKAHAEWMNRADTPYARMSPRAQRAFKQQATEVFRPIAAAAAARDADSYQEHNKRVDEVNLTASLNLMSKAAGDLSSPAWAESAATARAQYALQATRAWQVDPANVDPAQIKWRSPHGETQYNQKLKDFDGKAAGLRVQTLLQMAAAIPVGTPEADAKAQQLTDYAAKFATVWTAGGKDPVMDPESIAKAHEAAQKIAEERIRQTATLERDRFDTAERDFLNFQLGFVKDPAKTKASFALLAPLQQRGLKLAAEKLDAATEQKTVEDEWNRFYTSDQSTPAARAAWNTMIQGLKTPAARAAAKEVMDNWDSGQTRKTIREMKNADEARRGYYNAQLELGIDSNGSAMPEFARIEHGLKLLEAGLITAGDFGKFKEHLVQSRNTPSIADDVLATVGTAIGVEPTKMVQYFSYSSGAFDFKPQGKLKRNPADMSGMGKVAWTDERGKSRVEDLSAQLVRNMLNLAMKHQEQIKLGEARGKAPDDLRTFLSSMLDPKTNATVRELNAAIVEDNILEQTSVLRDLETITATRELRATEEGIKRRGPLNGIDQGNP